MTAREIFNQKNGDVTKEYYSKLNAAGPSGQLAVALFRAQKRSSFAKKYRSGRFRRAAYDVKNWSLSEICRVLTENPGLVRTWGWKEDPATPGFEWVLYVDLPFGQVSFHSAARLTGPDYSGDWDRSNESERRILMYADLAGEGGVNAGR